VGGTGSSCSYIELQVADLHVFIGLYMFLQHFLIERESYSLFEITTQI
jgi:hypothetical protein